MTIDEMRVIGNWLKDAADHYENERRLLTDLLDERNANASLRETIHRHELKIEELSNLLNQKGASDD